MPIIKAPTLQSCLSLQEVAGVSTSSFSRTVGPCMAVALRVYGLAGLEFVGFEVLRRITEIRAFQRIIWNGCGP